MIKSNKISALLMAIVALSIPVTVAAVASEKYLSSHAATSSLSFITNGVYELSVSNPNVDITCVKGKLNCQYSAQLTATNKTTKSLYKTTIWTGGSPNNKLMQYVDFNGNWTTALSSTDKVYAPGEVVNTLIKVVPPQVVGEYWSYFYIDGKQCNLGVTPPDCMYAGGSSLTVKFKVIDPTPTPMPTSTSVAPLKQPGYPTQPLK